ncbi:catenin alpha-3 [Cricetulus griseus]|nr:catenin alpha-3 [Cricetulus griseus]
MLTLGPVHAIDPSLLLLNGDLIAAFTVDLLAPLTLGTYRRNTKESSSHSLFGNLALQGVAPGPERRALI